MFLFSLLSNARVWGIGLIALLISTLTTPAIAKAADHPGLENEDIAVPYRLLFPLLHRAPPQGKADPLQVDAELPELPIDLPMPPSGILQWSLIDNPSILQSEALMCSVFDRSPSS